MSSSISFWRVLVSVHLPFWRVFEKNGFPHCTGNTKEHLCSPLVFGRVRVAHLISFLCCVFGRVRIAHLISFLCCVFGRVCVAHLISFLCCVLFLFCLSLSCGCCVQCCQCLSIFSNVYSKHQARTPDFNLLLSLYTINIITQIIVSA